MRLSPMKMLHLSTTWIKLVRDPRDLDQVFHMADKLNDPALMDEIMESLKEHPRAIEAFKARPRRGAVDLEALAALPEGTLGRAFADFLAEADLDPNDLPELPADDDASFTLAHLYETHDIWHTVAGFKSDVAGEVGLLSFYMAQFPGRLSPMLLSAALMNTAGSAMDDKDARMDQIARGWTLGKQADRFFGYDWAAEWERPLAEIRVELGITASLQLAA
jgi:ubiquinone biosynthesis protein COQ4